MILALAGGVGGAKLASGLAGLLSPARLTVIGNTGDDFEHLGLHVSPDLDSLMYWLAGLNDTERGWGLADESWNFMSAIRRLQEPDWFNLGDRDLATHVVRTLHLGKGSALSAVTELLARRLGIAHRLAPMTDDRVRTILTTDRGRLEFQEYFVRHKCEPKIVAIEYSGADAARMTGAFRDALADPRLEAIVICPSNPYLSIGPILAVPDVRSLLASSRAPVVAVSPIVAGDAVKGPLAKMLREFGHCVSPVPIAEFYRDLIDGLVIDVKDRQHGAPIEALGVAVRTSETIMDGEPRRKALAEEVLRFAAELREGRHGRH